MKTRRWYEDQVGRAFAGWLTFRGISDVSEITPPVIRAYLDSEANRPEFVAYVPERRTLSKKSIAHRYTSCRTFLEWCMRQGYMFAGNGNPAAFVRKPVVPEAVEIGFDRDEIDRLVKFSCTDRNRRNWLGLRDRAIVIVLLGTGARSDEILGLRIDDVDLTRERLRLFRKGQREGFMPMGTNMRQAIREYIAARPRVPDDALWLNLYGEPLNYQALRMMLRRLAECAGVANVHAHRFRHTYATEFYRANRDLVATQHALDHSQPATTMRYLKSLGFSFHLEARNPTPDTWLIHR